MIEYVLVLYWMGTNQKFDYQPPLTYQTAQECEAFRPKVDPRFWTRCVPHHERSTKK